MKSSAASRIAHCVARHATKIVDQKVPVFAKPRYCRLVGLVDHARTDNVMYTMHAGYNYIGTFDMHGPTANVTSIIAVISVVTTMGGVRLCPIIYIPFTAVV